MVQWVIGSIPFAGSIELFLFIASAGVPKNRGMYHPVYMIYLPATYKELLMK